MTNIPPGITYADAIIALHNHDLLIRLDPEFASYETLPSDPATPNTKRYKVTDHMRALPKGLWDSTVTFEGHITDVDDGIDWLILAPLGLRQTTTWRLVKTDTLPSGDLEGLVVDGEKGEYCLVENVKIEANRLLTGTVKGKCQENWKGVHGRFVERLKKGDGARVGA